MRSLMLVASAAVIAIFSLVQLAQRISTDPVTWHMVNVNDTRAQGDAHLLLTSRGRSVLIDAGDYTSAERKLVPYLQERNISTIDHVFVSHPHKDHYGGLMALAKAGIRFKNVYFNLPDKYTCDGEVPWGCDYQHILNTRAELGALGSRVSAVGKNFRVSLGYRTSLTVIYSFDNSNTPVGPIDINDLSLIIRLQNRNSSVLFTGDLNERIGRHLAEVGENLQATILKVPHHGTEGVAPNEFFEKVNPEISMVPAPAWLWCSERSKRIRVWHQVNHIPVYVNGFHGSIVTTFNDNDLTVKTEFNENNVKPERLCDGVESSTGW